MQNFKDSIRASNNTDLGQNLSVCPKRAIRCKTIVLRLIQGALFSFLGGTNALAAEASAQKAEIQKPRTTYQRNGSALSTGVQRVYALKWRSKRQDYQRKLTLVGGEPRASIFLFSNLSAQKRSRGSRP